ncbi:MAG: T9SS type A sorting domain-containing protein [bacterium]|nr:T9SS type A sorting domain-containing protein [bacterium]
MQNDAHINNLIFEGGIRSGDYVQCYMQGDPLTNNTIYFGGVNSGYNYNCFAQDDALLNNNIFLGGTSSTNSNSCYLQNDALINNSIFSGGTFSGNGVGCVGSLNNEVPLPVELIFFNANIRENFVELKWKTAVQINNDYFVVEKSLDAQNWNQLVMVKGAGTTYIPMEYLEIDPHPYNGINYYRLKQIDWDGKYSYSNMVAVEYKKNIATNNKEPIIFPNPIEKDQQLNIQFPDWYTEALVVLRDMMGKEVFSKVIVFEENNLLYAIPLDKEIPSGVYLITASNSHHVLFSKKVIVK